MTEILERLKSVLRIPSTYRKETLVIDFVSEYCNEKGYDYVIDSYGSVHITKGSLDEGEYFPLVCAHMDTVHSLETKTIKEENGNLTAWNDKEAQVGIGGDDLCGVFLCLEMLDNFDKIKVALFVSEEIGCVGSRNSSVEMKDFYGDVGYCVEFDGPEDYMVTQFCDGEELFEHTGDFIVKSLPHLREQMGEKMRMFSHPYTDVSILKRAFKFSCINISPY